MDNRQVLRVPLRIKQGKKRPEREKIFETLYGTSNIALQKLIDVQSGFIAICLREEDVEKLLSEDTSRALGKIGIETKVPTEIASQRSIICRKLDVWVGKHTPAEIKAEVQKNHSWAKVREVVKFGQYTHIVKIIFETTQMAQKATEGIFMFHMGISKEQIQIEEFINVQICFTCYKMESHQSKDCPNKQSPICSECGEKGHKWTECTNTIKMCINCGGAHRTMAMACPIKKEIIKNKKEQKSAALEKRENLTYAKVAKEAISQDKTSRPILQINKDTRTDILICIMHAHVINMGRPGSYATELNKMLKQNNLQEMWFPENPPSNEILNMEIQEEPIQERITERETSTKKKTHFDFKTPTEPARQPSKKQRLPKKQPNYEAKWKKRVERHGELETESETEESITETESITSDLSVQNLISEIEVRKENKRQEELKNRENPNYDVKDLNMKIYTTIKNPFPKGNLTELLNGIKNKKHKYEYDSEQPENEIDTMLMQGRIKIRTENCFTIPPDIFHKKRNGKVKSPTIANETERRKSK